jgi:hypothetical protein
MGARSLFALAAIAAFAIVIALVLNRGTDTGDAAPTTTGPAETTATSPASSRETEPLDENSTTTAASATTSLAATTTAAESTTTAAPSGPTPTTLPAGSIVCETYGEITTVGGVESTDLVELSGLASSRLQQGVKWAHNDSRDGPAVYAIGPEGQDLGRYPVPGATAFDWEDIAAGPGPEPGVTYLYIGDIGDNFGIRGSRITVFRVPEVEPSPDGGVLTGVVALPFAYPDGPHNAEAIFVDPVDGSLHVVTKDADEAGVYRAGALVDGSELVELEAVGRLELGAEVTAADISWDGSIIALRGYESVWMWTRSDTQTVAEALLADPCLSPAPDEPQGEAIAFDQDDAYITISEGSRPPVHRIDRNG